MVNYFYSFFAVVNFYIFEFYKYCFNPLVFKLITKKKGKKVCNYAVFYS